ncbi:MAG: flagellin, partial [FCB group bacterium]
MATAISGGSRIRTNTPAENAYNALTAANNDIALRQLRLSTGKRINSASDDVAGYITSHALSARNGALKAALTTVGDANSVVSIASDSFDNINNLLTSIKDAAANASSGALGTDEKVALAKSAYRLAQQIQTVVDSTIFGGKELIKGAFSGSWTIGYSAANNLLTLGIDLTTGNVDFNVTSNNFDLNATNTSNFAGISGLDMTSLNAVSTADLGIFASSVIATTLTSFADALNNVSKVASYLGGVGMRLSSQQDLLTSQTTNYDAAISRIEDADVAQEQLALVKSQFLQQVSLISLTQANQ